MATHIKIISGIEYAYDVKTIWDKEQKKYRKKTKYLGKIVNQETKEYKRVRTAKVEKEKAILTYGDTYLLNEILKKSDILPAFLEILPYEVDTLKTLLFYKISDGGAMQHVKTWAEGNIVSKICPNASLDSQRISETLERLGDDTVQKHFFEKYIKLLSPNVKNVILDSTGLPNEINIPLTEVGHHGGGVELETRLVMAIDKNSKKPIYFRLIAGNINDVSTLVPTTAELIKYGLNLEFILLDSGYCSEKNIKVLYKSKIDFLTRLPAGRKLYKSLIIKTENTLEKGKNSVIYNKRSMYIQEVETVNFGHKCFAYVCEDVEEHGKQIKKFMGEAKEDKLSNEEYDEKVKFVGKFILISNKKLDINEVLPLYYTRQCAEQTFGIVKSKLDILPLRTHTKKTLKGYTFLCFLALVLLIELEQKLGDFASCQEVLRKSKNLYCKVFEDDLVVAETQKYINDVFKRLSITVPN